ncbi:MAG: hypothetical protein K2X74_16175 [Acetobacteraceae bacterium]|nr:hypothetical protein [Acetobacteraceae bacterium]
MTRAELEAQLRGQVIAAMRDGHAMGRPDPRQAELRTSLILSHIDAFVARQLEAEIDRLAGADPHAAGGG